METFVVRVWVPASEEPRVDGVHGTVTHVASGSSARFGTDAELIRFVRQAALSDEAGPADTPAKNKGGDRDEEAT